MNISLDRREQRKSPNPCTRDFQVILLVVFSVMWTDSDFLPEGRHYCRRDSVGQNYARMKRRAAGSFGSDRPLSRLAPLIALTDHCPVSCSREKMQHLGQN